MKNITLNTFNKDQRRLLQIGVILILVLFLVAYFFFHREATQIIGNNEVSLENSQLKVFNDTYTFDGYPDRILIHYPYFILVQGNKPLTIIYNLETKKKEKEVKDVLLDYYDGNILYNRKETYFNDKSLTEYCDAAFIKESNEILCITKWSRDSVDNLLLSIDPEKPNLARNIYQSDNILATVSVINDDLYVGEINFETKQSYLSINEKALPVENIVSLIYQIDGKPYFASFKSELNDNTASYYSIDNGQIIKHDGNKIIFFDL